MFKMLFYFLKITASALYGGQYDKPKSIRDFNFDPAHTFKNILITLLLIYFIYSQTLHDRLTEQIRNLNNSPCLKVEIKNKRLDSR